MRRHPAVRPFALLLLLAFVTSVWFTPQGRRPHTVAAARAESPDRSFVGVVLDTDAFIAIVTDDQELVAFVCDGTDAGVSLWAWFRGPVTEGRAELVATNGVTLLLDLTGESARGQVVTGDGRRLPFTTELAVGSAGLWRGEGQGDDGAVVGGWLVRNDGDQRGGFALGDGSVRTAPRLRITDGTSNTVAVAGGRSVPVQHITSIIAILIG